MRPLPEYPTLSPAGQAVVDAGRADRREEQRGLFAAGLDAPLGEPVDTSIPPEPANDPIVALSASEFLVVLRLVFTLAGRAGLPTEPLAELAGRIKELAE